MIGVNVCLYQEIRGCLAGRVRAVGIIGRRLIEKRLRIIVQASVHLVGGDMQELLSLLEGSVGKLPCRLGAVEHHRRSKHVGLHKHLRILDAAVHMALSREMHYPVDIVLLKNLHDGFLVADIRLHKSVILPVLDIFQILQVARIGQLVHVDDADLIVIFAEHVVDIIAPDESRAASYQISSHTDFVPPMKFSFSYAKRSAACTPFYYIRKRYIRQIFFSASLTAWLTAAYLPLYFPSPPDQRFLLRLSLSPSPLSDRQSAG